VYLACISLDSSILSGVGTLLTRCYALPYVLLYVQVPVLNMADVSRREADLAGTAFLGTGSCHAWLGEQTGNKELQIKAKQQHIR
jgi:hypothetical protein